MNILTFSLIYWNDQRLRAPLFLLDHFETIWQVFNFKLLFITRERFNLAT